MAVTGYTKNSFRGVANSVIKGSISTKMVAAWKSNETVLVLAVVTTETSRLRLAFEIRHNALGSGSLAIYEAHIHLAHR
jgi:hypothetical protein